MPSVDCVLMLCVSKRLLFDMQAQGLRPHPDLISETSAMASVPLPKLPYKMVLPQHVILSTLPHSTVA